MPQKFDLIVVGTGFASSFFLAAYLEKAKPAERILILERGRIDSFAWQLQNRRTSSTPAGDTFVNGNPNKPWIYNPSFGGGSNCWWACTPRMMPNDFRMKSVYNVGVDWPIGYDELEAFYNQVEAAMSVSGPDDGSPFPRSRPYPQPPHLFSDPDKLLKAAYPDQFFQQPTARARRATADRSKCCASGVCHLCPVIAKFTILNEMMPLYEDPRVTLSLNAVVQTVETRGSAATGVTYLKDGVETKAEGDLVVLGANALFNPHILLRSDLHHPLLGKFLHEQVSVTATVDLDGVDNFQGSTSITGHGYMLYDGSHRSKHAGCLIETFNVPNAFPNALRAERGKWRQRMMMRFIFEDLPSKKNGVKINADNPGLPETVFAGHSDYAQRGIDTLPERLPDLLKPLPVERFHIHKKPSKTEAHIIGTTVMGDDPEKSIVDRYLIHHKVRNLVVLGSGVFPTSSPANPTLTLSALTLWSANHLFG